MSAPTPDAQSAAGRIGLAETFRAVSLPILVGLLVRAIPVVTADFPLNDGGLFYAMTRDLQNADFLLPATTSYNGLDIPFAYPPLGFYVAGLLSSVLGIGLFDIFRFLPLILSTLTIPVVYLLGRELLPTRFQALLATWAFAFLPRAFDWSIAGGGVTRSLGLLIAGLAILAGVRYLKTSRVRDGVWMAVLAAFAAMSHLATALFTAVSLLLVLIAIRRTWRALRDSVILAGLAALVASPWWLSVVAVHGFTPFLSGGETRLDLRASFQHLTTFTFTDEPYTAFLAVIGLVGLLFAVSKGRYLLPAWVVVLMVVDPRSATDAMVPLAMLIAVAVDEVLLGSLNRVRDASDELRFWPRAVMRDRFARVMLAVGMLFGVIGGVQARGVVASPLRALDPDNRLAMAWIRDHADPGADFLVITGANWFVDADAEWFPVLTKHRSLNTVQGHEWLGTTAWLEQAWRNSDLQACVFETTACIEAWTRKWSAGDAWLFVPVKTIDPATPTGDCCAGLRASLATSTDYEVVFEGPGGAVFKPRLSS